MTDEQLAQYLGISDSPKWPAVVRGLHPGVRATYERMAQLEVEIGLWQQGLGPKPSGVLLTSARTPANAKKRVIDLRERIKKKFL